MIVLEFDLTDTSCQYLEDVRGSDIMMSYDVIIRSGLISVTDPKRGLVKVLKNRYDGCTGIVSSLEYTRLKKVSVELNRELFSKTP